MPSKSELQTILKEKYGINKNISQSLALEDCENLLAVLPSAMVIGSVNGNSAEIWHSKYGSPSESWGSITLALPITEQR